MTLGNLIKEYREKHNISMEEFSKRCSLSKGYISMLENNINPRSNKPIAPTLPTIKKIASAMNVDIDFILKTLDSNQEISLNSESEEPILYSGIIPNAPEASVFQINEQVTETPKIIQYYSQLNDIGKHEAEKRVKELTYLPQYTLEVKAAHNDHAAEPGELEKMREDISNLKKPD